MSVNQVYHEYKQFNEITVEQVREALERGGFRPKRDANGFRANCPAHHGADGHTMTVHPKSGGGVLLHCHSQHCSYQQILEALGLWEVRESPGQVINSATPKPLNCAYTVDNGTTIYQYQDESGADLYQNVRSPEKEFRQRRITSSGEIIWNLGEVNPVPYGLPELADPDFKNMPQHITEGEKDTIRLRNNGLLATSLSPGALHDGNLKYFKGRHVIIHEDNDDSGRKQAAKRAEWLTGTAASIRVMRYTDLPEKGDVSDWWDAGGSLPELYKRMAALKPVATTSSDPEWQTPEPLEKAYGPPIDPAVLPDSLRNYCEAMAASIQVPLDMVVTNALGLISTAITGQYAVDYYFSEPVHAMFVNVARPGERKSPLLKAMAGAIYRWQKEKQEQDRLLLAEWESTQRTLEKQRDSLEREPRKGEQSGENRDLLRRAAVQEIHDHETKKPVLTTVIIDDATPQAVAWLMVEQMGIAVVSAESAYLENFYRYSDSPDYNAFLSGHAAEPISIHRRSGKSATTERACLSLCMSIQPDSLERMGGVQGFMERGGTARLLTSIPQGIAGTRLTGRRVPRMPEHLSQWWDSLLVHLLETRDSATKESHIELSRDAFNIAEQFEDAVEARYLPLDDNDPYRGWMSKQVGAALRIAGLLHLVSKDASTQIDAATMKSAIAISEWYREHIAVAFSMMADTTDDHARIVWKVLKDWGAPSVNRRDLHSKLRGRTAFKRAADLDAPLTTLEELGYIRLRKVGNQDGGRPAEWIDVNPLANIETHTQNPQNPIVRPFEVQNLAPTGTEGFTPRFVEEI